MPETQLFTRGGYCEVTLSPEGVTKLSRAGYAYEDAAARCERLITYLGNLEEEPLDVAPVTSVDLVPQGGLYHLQHTQERITGPELHRTSPEQRNTLLARVLSGVADMTTIKPDVVRTPIDLTPSNCRIDQEGTPRLIDVYPPFIRASDGSFLRVGTRLSRANREKWLGTQSGIITRLLQGMEDPVTYPARSWQILTRREEWCYDLLPSSLDPGVKDNVRRQIRLRFVPHLAGIALARRISRLSLQ